MSYIVDLVHYLAWPVVVLLAADMFREPLGQLIVTFAERASRISVAKVKIELAHLSKASLPPVVVDNLAGMPASGSGLPAMAKAIREASQANYVTINLKVQDRSTWLTSRLYLLAATLERIRGTDCIVFTSGDHNEYVGTAAPREIRWSLGISFPAYEKAFASALGQLATPTNPSAMFQRGLADDLIDQFLNAFVRHAEISRPNQPPQLAPGGPPEAPPGGPPPQWPPPGWVPLSQGGNIMSYENAQWVSANLLRDMLRDRFDGGVIVDKEGRGDAETTKLVLEQTGTFVAVVEGQRKFKDLVDRSRLTDQVGREAARQMAESDAASKRRARAA
jgi:hypothetical protein